MPVPSLPTAPASAPPPAIAKRAGWKKGSTVLGKGSGVLLLALAAIALLGVLFVVFSLLE
jgi:hypothetical protein